MDKVYDKCCGIDLHKKLIVACFKQGNRQEIRDFGATTRELLEKLYSMPEYLSEFDEIIFEDLVEKAVVESSSCIRFKLINGVEISESLERPVR